MKEREAREIDKKYREQMAMPIEKIRELDMGDFVPTMEFKKAQGYLEAIEKARMWEDVAKEIKSRGKHPTYAITHGPLGCSTCLISDTLAKWEKEK